MSKHDIQDLRAAFGSFMTGVTVVTAMGPDGQPVGFTANSFTSVSLDPPLLLVCPGNHLSSLPVFKEAAQFAVNVLAHDQKDVSNIFASSKGDRFSQVAWSADALGSPMLIGAAAHFACRTYQRVEAGDHLILIGQVERFGKTDRAGLGYASTGYFSLGDQSLMPKAQLQHAS